jgi:dihydroorotase-like cyclic amidohydrolase
MRSLLLLLPLALAAQIVMSGGRVIDPESGLDAVRYVGNNGKKIAAISTSPLHGKIDIDANGLVVTPGLIDLHSHGQTPEAYRYKAIGRCHHGTRTRSRRLAGQRVVCSA